MDYYPQSDESWLADNWVDYRQFEMTADEYAAALAIDSLPLAARFISAKVTPVYVTSELFVIIH